MNCQKSVLLETNWKHLLKFIKYKFLIAANEAVVGAVSSTSQFVNDATLISPETEGNYTIHLTVEDEHVNDELVIDDEPVVNQTDITKESVSGMFCSLLHRPYIHVHKTTQFRTQFSQILR